MKLATVSVEGKVLFGAVNELGFVDLSERLGEQCACLADLLGEPLLRKSAQIVAETAVDYPMHALRFLPPIANRRMFALGVAYKEHRAEVGRAEVQFPNMFPKYPSSFVGHEAPLCKPSTSDQFDFEGEIVIVIGKGGRHIPQATALDHVAGYSIANDGSVRDWQKHSLVAGKNFDASSSYGPWIVTSDEIPEPGHMELFTRVNGVTMQHAMFDELLWTPAFLVHYVSTFTRLEPGDAISTGTPAGVGHRRSPPYFMKAGDSLEIEVLGIGKLRNAVVDET